MVTALMVIEWINGWGKRMANGTNHLTTMCNIRRWWHPWAHTRIHQISQYIFEETFNLRFAIPFEQHNNTVSTATLNGLTPVQRRKMEKLNALDIELYEFAKKLMFQRWVNNFMCLLSNHVPSIRRLDMRCLHLKSTIVFINSLCLCRHSSSSGLT